MTAHWTIDDDDRLVWGQEGHTPHSLGLDVYRYEALVADVRAARLADEQHRLMAEFEKAGLLDDEYPDDMARRSCTCDGDAICGAHRLLGRYSKLFDAFQQANREKREAKAAARLVDDLAAVIDTAIRALDALALDRREPERYRDEFAAASERFREVAALHHARQPVERQPGPCSLCGAPTTRPDQFDVCDECYGSDHARQEGT